MSRRERQRRRRRHRGSPVLRVVLMGGVLGVCALALAALGVVGWVVAIANSAPNLSQLKPKSPGQPSQVFASDGSLLGYTNSPTLHTQVNDSEIPASLKQATVSIEDRRFYKHGGVDYQGILRAGVKDVLGGGRTIQGGSTLTMQLVDNDYLPNNISTHRNVKYKIIQAKLANELEQRMSKRRILTKYLNDVPYGTLGGQTAIGVGAAARMFFDRQVSQLDLAQAALLAGLPQAPSEYNPFLARTLARTRRHEVLQAMVQSGYITQDSADAADAQPLELHRNAFYSLKQQPYVFDYVQQALNQRYCPDQKPTKPCQPVDAGGLKIYTTIDLTKQKQAAQAIANHEGQPGDPAAAVVTVDPSDGHILAMQTSSSYAQSNFDYATQSLRQTGSAFKPFVLMTLIHDFHGDPDQTYYNSQELLPGWLPTFPTYHVQTAEHGYLGSINVTKATVLSDNTVFAQLAQDVTMAQVTDTAHAMGITSPLSGLPSEALGAVAVSPLQVADAYATLAGQGYHTPPTAISKVVLPDGKVDTSFGSPTRTKVFTDGEAYAATQVLTGVIKNGTGTAAQIGCPAAGKTGTTSNYTDAWFVGYTPQLATAVWVGYPKSTVSMNDVNGLGPGYGGTLAAPIWHDYMAQAIGGSCGDFPQPTAPFHGTSFFGKFAVTGNPSSGSGNSSNSGNSNGSGSSNGYGNNGSGSSGTATGPYTTPQPGSGGATPGTGGTGGTPPGGISPNGTPPGGTGQGGNGPSGNGPSGTGQGGTGPPGNGAGGTGQGGGTPPPAGGGSPPSPGGTRARH